MNRLTFPNILLATLALVLFLAHPANGQEPCCHAGETTTEQDCNRITTDRECEERKCKWACTEPCCCRAISGKPDDQAKCCSSGTRDECARLPDICSWNAASRTCAEPEPCCCGSITGKPEEIERCCKQGTTKDECSQFPDNCVWNGNSPTCNPLPPSPPVTENCCCHAFESQYEEKCCYQSRDGCDLLPNTCKWDVTSDKCNHQPPPPTEPCCCRSISGKPEEIEKCCGQDTRDTCAKLPDICVWNGNEPKCNPQPPPPTEPCCCMSKTGKPEEIEKCCGQDTRDTCAKLPDICVWNGASPKCNPQPPPPTEPCCCMSKTGKADEIEKCCGQDTRDTCAKLPDICVWNGASPKCNPQPPPPTPDCCCKSHIAGSEEKCCQFGSKDKCSGTGTYSFCFWDVSDKCNPTPPPPVESCCCSPLPGTTGTSAECCKFGDRTQCIRSQVCNWSSDEQKCPDCCCESNDPSQLYSVARCCAGGKDSAERCSALMFPTGAPMCHWNPDSTCTKPPECCCEPLGVAANPNIPLSEYKRCCRASGSAECAAEKCNWKMDETKCPKDCCCHAKEPWNVAILQRCCKDGLTFDRCSSIADNNNNGLCVWNADAAGKCPKPIEPCCCKPKGVINPSQAIIKLCCDLNDPTNPSKCNANPRCQWNTDKTCPVVQPSCCCKPSANVPNPTADHFRLCCGLTDGANPDKCMLESSGRCQWDGANDKCGFNCCCEALPGTINAIQSCCKKGASKEQCLSGVTTAPICKWNDNATCKRTFEPLH